jgi:hypothetical protein
LKSFGLVVNLLQIFFVKIRKEMKRIERKKTSLMSWVEEAHALCISGLGP